MANIEIVKHRVVRDQTQYTWQAANGVEGVSVWFDISLDALIEYDGKPEEVLGEKDGGKDGKLVLIKWKNHSEARWEPRALLSAMEEKLGVEFIIPQNQPKKKKKRKRRRK